MHKALSGGRKTPFIVLVDSLRRPFPSQAMRVGLWWTNYCWRCFFSLSPPWKFTFVHWKFQSTPLGWEYLSISLNSFEFLICVLSLIVSFFIFFLNCIFQSKISFFDFSNFVLTFFSSFFSYLFSGLSIVFNFII